MSAVPVAVQRIRRRAYPATVAVFRCVAALSLNVMVVAGMWLHCVTFFGHPGRVSAMSRAL